MPKEKGKKSLISKTIETCRSFGRAGNQRAAEKTPAGCFSVYVGPEKERFAVRAEHASHPLFRALLEEAVGKYGYSRDGPIELPCDIELFNRVIEEVEDRMVVSAISPMCGLTRGRPEYDLLGISRPRAPDCHKARSKSFS